MLEVKKFTENARFEDLFFDVDIHDSKDVMNGFKFQQEESKVIIRKDNNKVLNFCSPQYKLEKNSDLILPIYEELSKTFEIETRVKIENEARFFVELILKSNEVEVVKGDYINPCIVIQNSYNNSIRRSVSVGFYRLICTNGLKAFNWETQSAKKHSGTGKFNTSELNQMIKVFSTERTLLDRMKDAELSEAQADKLIKEVSENKKIEYPNRIIKGVKGVLEREARQLNVQFSKWLVYNAFNHELNHSPMKLAENKRFEIDKKVLDFVIAN